MVEIRFFSKFQTMMNHCLKTACEGSEYIHFQGQKPFKFEENGVFRYVKYTSNEIKITFRRKIMTTLQQYHAKKLTTKFICTARLRYI